MKDTLFLERQFNAPSLFCCKVSKFVLPPWTWQIFLYGGYSKEISPDKSGSEKGNVHSDMWSLDPKTWEWNKVLAFP